MAGAVLRMVVVARLRSQEFGLQGAGALWRGEGRWHGKVSLTGDRKSLDRGLLIIKWLILNGRSPRVLERLIEEVAGKLGQWNLCYMYVLKCKPGSE